MPGTGSDSLMWFSALPLLLAVALAHALLWRAARRGGRGWRWLALAVLLLTMTAAGLLMVMAEWLPWLPGSINLDDPDGGMGAGLRLVGVNLAATLVAALVPVGLVLALARRMEPTHPGGRS